MFQHNRTSRHLVGLWLLGSSSLAWAELPLDIEGLLTDKGTLKAELSTTYANRNRSGISVDGPITIQLGPTQFVTLPSRVGEIRTNSDVVIPAVGLRYGLIADTEVYGRATWLYEHARIQDTSAGISSRSDNRFNDAWFGINHRFIYGEESPVLLGFVEAALAERYSQSTAHGKSWLIGATIYRSSDPVVLLLTSAYRFNAGRAYGIDWLKPGNLFLLNPTVSFAVNDKVTLTTGLMWRNQGDQTINGSVVGQRNTSTTLNLGFAYLWDKGTTVTLDSRSEVSGIGGVQIGFAVQIKLGKVDRNIH